MEYASIPRMMAAAATTKDCCQGAMEHKEHGQSPKSSKDCHSTPNCCMNCPMCYVMLLPAMKEPEFSPGVKRVYAEVRSSYLYTYYVSSWKPPNRG